MKTEILERAKLPNGTLVRLQKRGKAYDVITNSTGITWRYLEKAVSEERARNAFDLYTMQHKQNPMKTIQAKRKPTPAQIAARERFAEMARSGAFKRKAKRNPTKKTVSQKISQLTREGYPQKQAVAIALSEERAGKVRQNPSAKDSRTEVHLGGRYYGLISKNSGLGHYTDIVYRDPRDFEGDKVVPDFNGRYYQSMNAALRALERYKKKMILENPRASNPIILVSDKPITSKRKANPVKPKDMTVYQVQYRKPGMKLFEPWMTVMYPKMAEDIARRLADEPMAQTWTIKVESIKVKG